MRIVILKRLDCVKNSLNWLLLLVGLIAVPALAMELTPKNKRDYAYYNVNAYLSYYEDHSEILTIEDVVGMNGWRRNTEGTVLNFGFVNYPVWIKFPANIDQEASQSWHLVIPYPLLQHAEVFIVSKDNNLLWSKNLETAPGDFKTLVSHHINFALPKRIEPDSTIYLKVRSNTSLQVPLELWERDYLVVEQNFETLLWGLYFGLVVALILYNTFLFISLRTAIYIYYVLTLLSVMTLMLCLSGFGHRYMWGSPAITIMILPLSATMASFWLLCFCVGFLESRNIVPWIRYSMKALAVVALFIMTYISFVPEKGALIAGWLGTFTIALVLMAGVTSLLRGQVIARYFVLATASFGLGSLLYLANVFALLPSSRLTNHSIQAGSVLEALLFSFALAHRFKEERRKKLEAMEKMELAQRTIVQVQNQALQQALHDPITKKPNEFLLSKSVNDLIASDKAWDTFAVVLMSFPQIKQIASSMGRRLSEEVFESIIFTLEEKLGYEEQAVMVEHATNSYVAVSDFGSLAFISKTGNGMPSVNEFVGSLIRLYDTALNVGETSIQLDAYCGIAAYPKHGDRAELLLQHAGAARDYGIRTAERLSVYSSEIDTFGRRRLALVGALSKAVRDKELKLYLQPQFECSTQTLAGAEVLLRWNSQKFGVVSPDEFIEVAEEAGLMSSITRYLVDEAFIILSEMKKTNLNIKLSINLSTQNLTEPDFVPFVVAKAEQHKINLADVVFEVTETYLSANMDVVVSTLNQLGSAGCLISLDDYGTGYSSLMYLSQLPVNELKIDRSFISQTERSVSDYRIVENTVKLARALKLETVAEGVENQQTLNSLVKLGCNRVQGYYFAKPMPVSQFHEWVHRRAS